MMTRPALAAVGLVLAAALLPIAVHTDDPISSSVTFNREIVRIFQRKCVPCHEPGGVAMSLTTYRDARPWSRAIREELVARRMPPWGAAPGYTAFARDFSLTQREVATILTWTDGGAPRGDLRDLPADVTPVHSTSAEPTTLRVPLPAQRIPAGEEYVFRRVAVTTGTDAPLRLSQVRLVPGNARVLRGAFLSFTTNGNEKASSGRWIGAWTPWQAAVGPPEDATFVVPAGSALVAELHYRGRDVELEDRSALELIAVPRTEAPAAGQLDIALPLRRGVASPIVKVTTTVREPVRVWAVVPRAGERSGISDSENDSPADHLSESRGSLEVTARLPNGGVHVLLWVPRFQREWPAPYVLRDPVLLPAGTSISVVAKGNAASAGLTVTLGTTP